MNTKKTFKIPKKYLTIGIGTVTAFIALAIVIVSVLAVNGAGFEIDGNMAVDDPPNADDWESVILGTDPDWDAGPGLLIRDGSSGPKAINDELNIFAKGGKFGVPEEWTIEPGNTPAQNDLTNVYVYPVLPNGSEHTWMVMGMERIKKQGTFDLDFEYNQVPWDGTSGTLVRTPGDISIGFELSGNPDDPAADLEVLVLVYDPDDVSCSVWDAVYGEGWCVVFSGSGGALGAFGEATMNAVEFPEPPWGSFESSGAPLEPPDDWIQPFYFAEAALDLTALNLEPGCPGFGSVHAKSRSSLEITADMKDLAGPIALPIQCKIFGHKYEDVNGDGDLSDGIALDGWTIDLYLYDNDTSTYNLYTSTTTDAFGYYEFGGLSDGTYRVKEVCPDGWAQTVPAPTNGCGSGVHAGIILNVSDTNLGPYDFGNARGSIIVKKVDGYGALLPGAGFTFDPNPFDGGVAIEIFDGGGDDQANGSDGILCIDGVVLDSYQVTESTPPAGYAGDPLPQTVLVSSSSTCADRLADTYTADATFTNLLGSIIIRKEDGYGEDLAGAGFNFEPNPFDGGAGINIDDGGLEDQANGDDGILCIDDVLLGSYDITEYKVPAGYAGDTDTETVTVDSASTCEDRLSGEYTADATFTNLLGSIIIRKEDGYGADLAGAGFTFNPNPFDGGVAIEIDDGGLEDQANGDDGILCIDDVRMGSYDITETQVPDGYAGDTDTETVTVDSASTCLDRLAAGDDPDATFTNLLGSIIIRKEAKNANFVGNVLLPGAGFTFNINPFDGGAEDIEILDGGEDDQAPADGILCIDDVLLASYDITETTVPANYQGDPGTENVVVSSSSTCEDRLADAYTADATFVNVPLSEIEVIFRSLAGYGVTVATITCEDEFGTVMVFDSGTNDEDETFTDLLPGTYFCTIYIDP